MLDSELIDLMDCLSGIGQAQTPLDKLLEIYKKIEDLNPHSNISLGGSLGLYLHGIDLGRNFVNSDIDICCDGRTENLSDERWYAKKETRSSTEMDGGSYITSVFKKGENKEIKIEYKIDFTQDFKKVEYKGVTYNVTLPEIILGWKILFASRGSVKHKGDLDKLGIKYKKRGIFFFFSPFRKKFREWKDLGIILEKKGLSGKFFPKSVVLVEKNGK